MSAAVEIVEVGVEEVDRARPLWEEMVLHHGELAAGTVPVRAPAAAWERRGEGIGSRLIEAARARLREQGVEYWTVSVLDANEGATRLYGREGFQPFFRALGGRV